MSTNKFALAIALALTPAALLWAGDPAQAARTGFFNALGLWQPAAPDQTPAPAPAAPAAVVPVPEPAAAPAPAAPTPGADRAELVRTLRSMLDNVELNQAAMEKAEIVGLFRDIVRQAEADARITAAPPAAPAPARAPAASAPISTATAPAMKPVVKVSAFHPAVLPPAGNVVLDAAPVNLAGLVDHMRKASGINVVMDNAAIRAGIRSGAVRTTITLKVDGMTVKNALNWICRLSGLTWTLKDEAVFITTPDRIDATEPNLRVYDIRDQLAPIPDFPAPHVAFGKSDDPMNYR
ncbi:MAG: hypothetical protein ABIF71_06950 [Planctomycetota bacterium]